MTAGQSVCREQIQAKRVVARLTSGGVGAVALLCTALALTATPALATASVKASPVKTSTVKVSPAKSSTVKAGTSKASSQAPTAADWPAYLDGPGHASYNASQTVITPTTAPSLTRLWAFSTGAPYQASPAIADGRVFIGSENGWFYKLSMYTGKVLAKVYLGRQPARTCNAAGITSTATVAVNPHNKVLTVYVTGGDGYLYALKASNLRREWRSVIGIPSTRVNDYYDWSSPTVSHGRVYVGVASSCDNPLVRGGLLAFDEGTGKRLGQFFTVPAGAGHAGGSVWSSIAVARGGDVYATTGNGPSSNQFLQNSDSILKLSPVRLRLLGSFKLPRRQVTPDGDFGGSPVFFGSYVGACNKNGVFYALSQATMKLVWSKRIANSAGGAAQCLATPAYNGTDLFFGGGFITINGTRYVGSVQERAPSTGTLLWSTGLADAVLGSPTLDGGGVLTAGTFGGPNAAIYLIDAASGAVIKQLTTGQTFGQSVFARGRLFTANSNGVAAWGLPAS
jgi:outer membrane protein assembly factor BamB